MHTSDSFSLLAFPWFGEFSGASFSNLICSQNLVNTISVKQIVNYLASANIIQVD